MNTTLTPAVHHIGERRRCAMCNGPVFTFAEELNSAGQVLRSFCAGCARKRAAGALVAGDRVDWADVDSLGRPLVSRSSGVVSGYVSATRYQVRTDDGRDIYASRDELDRIEV